MKCDVFHRSQMCKCVLYSFAVDSDHYVYFADMYRIVIANKVIANKQFAHYIA